MSEVPRFWWPTKEQEREVRWLRRLARLVQVLGDLSRQSRLADGICSLLLCISDLKEGEPETNQMIVHYVPSRGCHWAQGPEEPETLKAMRLKWPERSQGWTLVGIVEQLRSCGYTCEAGPLELNVAFLALVDKAMEKFRKLCRWGATHICMKCGSVYSIVDACRPLPECFKCGGKLGLDQDVFDARVTRAIQGAMEE